MKHSIIKICKKLSSALFLNTLLTIFIALFIFEQNFSYNKIDNLNQQRELINTLINPKEADKELSKIKTVGTASLLLAKIDKLKQLYHYDFVGKFIIFSKKEYLTDLEQLKQIAQQIKTLTNQYYDDVDQQKQIHIKLQNTFKAFNKKLNDLYIKNAIYNQQKSFLITQLTIALLLLSILTTIFYRKKVHLILSDISFLSAIHPTSKNYKTKTIEADAILVKMNKKNTNTIDPSLLDPVTELLNHNGLSKFYLQKKDLKPQNYTSLTLLEVDNFSQDNKQYPPEMIQTILKKIASIITLYEQSTDVLARTGFNQFTLILSRSSKEQCLREIEQIVQTVEEIKFKLNDGTYTNISLSGGFLIKTKKRSLHDAIQEAEKILTYAKNKGGNMIAQARDLKE